MNCRSCGEALARKRFGKRLEDLGAFSRRVFCDRACMALWMEGRIKVPNEKNSRRQSAKLASSSCRSCGRRAAASRMYVHHLDGNAMNNSGRNLRTLCGSCHRRSHSPNFTENGKARRPCLHCDKPSMKRRLCFTHLTRFKKHGDPLVSKRKVGSEWRLMRLVGTSWCPIP